MDRQRPAVFSAALISLLMAVFALVMAWTTTDDGSEPPARPRPPRPASAGTPARRSAMAARRQATATASGTATFDITIDDFTFSPGDARWPRGRPSCSRTTTRSITRSSPTRRLRRRPRTSSRVTPIEVTLTEPGSYPYTCGIHQLHDGTITVQG